MPRNAPSLARGSVVVLEGPSAVGKTTLATRLGSTGAEVVPEVAALFARPTPEPPAWYLHRQIERWQRAWRAACAGRMAVLDGDPLQPLWYNAAYGNRRMESLDTLVAVYRPALLDGALGLPDRYVLLSASEATLRHRREGDSSRQRRGFERHLAFVSYQRRYVEAMASLAPDRVTIVDRSTTEKALPLVPCHPVDTRGDLAVFDALIDWLRDHPAGVPIPPGGASGEEARA